MIEWIEKYYYDLVNCKYRECCKRAAEINTGHLFYPIPPKVFCTNPKIIFFAMEPSSSFAENDIDARNKINNGIRNMKIKDNILHYSKGKLHINLKYILDNDHVINNKCKSDLSIIKNKLYHFVKNVTRKSPIGTGQALKEIENDKYLIWYSKLAIAYREILKRHLKEIG